jgi:hypothetical protein
MPFFEDSDQLYAVARDLLTRVQEEIPSASDNIARSHLVIRLATTEPTAEFTLNGRKRPVEITYGPTRLRPSLDLSLQADTLHGILLDELSLKRALANGLIKAQGPVLKLAALADLFRAGRQIYPQVLRDQGPAPDPKDT